MSLPPAEERKLQHIKIDRLAHIEWLLERLIWTLAPGNLDFKVFQDIVLRRDYNASRLESPAEVLRDLPARSAARDGQVPGHESVQNARVLRDTYEDLTILQVP